MLPDQRWAYDLLITEDGRSHRNGGSRLDDYYAYGRPVLAPAAGVVRATYDDQADGPVGQWAFLRSTGNHLILEVAPAEFLFIAHLQRHSIVVAPGDRVRAGQVIGRVGNSGNSSEPHVHLHLQDTPTPYLGEGIPFYFHNYLTGGVRVERGMPAGGRQRRSRGWPGAFTGQIVEHAGRH
jgi:murein DD-endopeptidase MepM/ murein hydrolase activator NlpD